MTINNKRAFIFSKYVTTYAAVKSIQNEELRKKMLVLWNNYRFDAHNGNDQILFINLLYKIVNNSSKNNSK